MCEDMINSLKFIKPSEVIAKLNLKNGKGLYFIALKKEKENIFEGINTQLHHELQEREVCKTENGDSIIYIGQAKGKVGLLRRLNQELYQVGRAAFFRSIGAVLMLNPYRGQNHPQYYKFKDPVKNAIIDFMEENFLIAYKIYDDNNIKQHEINCITNCQPLFNDIHNPNPSQETRNQRERCRTIASEPRENE